MRYRYSQARGAINQAAIPGDPASRQRANTPLWRGRRIPGEVLELIPESFAREHQVVPITTEGSTVVVAASDATDIALSDKLSFLIARPVKLVPASRDEITSFLLEYGATGDFETVDSCLQEFTESGPPPPVPRASRGGIPRGGAAGHGTPATVTAWRSASDLKTIAEAGAPISRRTAPVSLGLDPTSPVGGSGVVTYVVEEGQRVLIRRPNGTMDVIIGPRRVWRVWNVFRPMQHYVAHPGDYLLVRYRDGRQEHLPGPSEVWFDPRVHQEVTREEALQVAAKEAVVIYSSKEGTSQVQRRIEYGPTLFIPRPGEWLHTFAWHASQGGSEGNRKIPRGLVFQKLWLMPDQMYHDVPDVRTADDAVLTIRLMIFFELQDINTMLETTHDPIGDFVNAATSDVVDFTGRHDFESFKRNTDKLNELETYRQLVVRATQCGYRINKVVYRGYGAPERLQQMHDQAIEARTKLQLERATEQQAQDLENFKLDSQMLRAGKRRHEQSAEVQHELELGHKKQEAGLRDQEARSEFLRRQKQLEADLHRAIREQQDNQQREHLAALRSLGVDLTAFLTQARADRVIELRGSAGSTHVHLDPSTIRDGISPSLDLD